MGIDKGGVNLAISRIITQSLVDVLEWPLIYLNEKIIQ